MFSGIKDLSVEQGHICLDSWIDAFFLARIQVFNFNRHSRKDTTIQIIKSLMPSF
jgi:hypothetical protein